jgi:CheY-like chemotaxis protein
MGPTMREKPVVLVVDDDKNIARHVAQILRPAGFIVHPTHEGSWMQAVAALKPDVILIDSKFRSAPDDKTCQCIRGVGSDAKVFMMVTGAISESDRRWAKQCRVDDFILKPLRQDDLLKMLSMSGHWKVFSSPTPTDGGSPSGEPPLLLT